MAAELTAVARPYAKAAFEYAKEHQEIQAWSEALQWLAALVSDPQMGAQINNPTLSRERLCELLLELGGERLKGGPDNLVRLLAAKGRLAAIPEIARLFEEQRVADQGVRQVLVRSAFAIDEDQKQALAAALARRLGAQVDLSFEVDAGLIGGVEVRAGDLVIDHSVRGRIKQLANALQL